MESQPHSPLCGCHNGPMRWNSDVRYRAGGFWKCLEKDRLYQRTAYQRNPSPQRQRVSRYQASAQGSTRRRRRDLALQRGRILEKLAHLKQEAVNSC